MIAAIYTRVSTDEQAREGLSLPVQERRLREVAERDGCAEIRAYVDDGYTGFTLDRPAVQRLLDDMPELQVIYAVDQSRISREPAHMEVIRARLSETETLLVLLDGHGDIQTPHGELYSTMDAAIDRMQVRVSRAKAAASLQMRAEGGRHHGRAPLGYDYARDQAGRALRGATLDVMPVEADLVRRIFAEFARGRSLTAIARGLNADGVEGKRGASTWFVSTLTRVLGNPTYLGLVRYNDRTHPGDHEAIISERLWHEVKARRGREEHMAPPQRVSLSPLFECGLCGGRIAKTTCGAGGAVQAYRCQDRFRRPAADRHEPLQKACSCVEAVVWTWVRELLGGELLEQPLQHLAGAPPKPPDRPGLEAQLAEVETAIAYNLDAARAGGLPPDMLAGQQAPLLSRREELLAILRSPADAGRYTPGQLRWLRDAGPEVVNRLAALRDPGRQRQVLERLFATIEMHPAGLLFRHRLPAIEPCRIAWPAYHGPHRGFAPPTLTPW